MKISIDSVRNTIEILNKIVYTNQNNNTILQIIDKLNQAVDQEEAKKKAEDNNHYVHLILDIELSVDQQEKFNHIRKLYSTLRQISYYEAICTMRVLAKMARDKFKGLDEQIGQKQAIDLYTCLWQCINNTKLSDAYITKIELTDHQIMTYQKLMDWELAFSEYNKIIEHSGVLLKTCCDLEELPNLYPIKKQSLSIYAILLMGSLMISLPTISIPFSISWRFLPRINPLFNYYVTLPTGLLILLVSIATPLLYNHITYTIKCRRIINNMLKARKNIFQHLKSQILPFDHFKCLIPETSHNGKNNNELLNIQNRTCSFVDLST